MMAKIVGCAATFELLKGLMAVGADRLVAITNTAPGADKIALARGQGPGVGNIFHRLRAYFHPTMQINAILGQKKEGHLALDQLTLILLHMRHQTLTLALLRRCQQIAFAFVRVFTLFKLNADRRSHHVK